MRARTLLMLASLMLMGTITLAQSVTYDFDKTANFAAFRTYAWVLGTPLPDALNHQRITGAVEAQLTLKGLRQVEAGANPDLLIAYHANFERNLQINAWGFGDFRFAGSRSGSARAQQVLVGTLVIDMVDARTRHIVWRGMASDDVDMDAKPERRERNINKAAEKLFKHYPPGR